MSYILRRTDGSTLSSITDGSINTTSTSLAFPGKNYSPYSVPIADNMVKLLENFSGNTAPIHPLSGQLWYDRAAASVKVFAVGNVWRTIGTTVSSVVPTTQAAGEFWFNSTAQQLFVKNSSGVYVLIGPTAPAGFGETDVKAETMTGNVDLIGHQVLGMFASGRRLFVLNGDAAFTTANTGASYGFPIIYTGMTANVAIPANRFGGIATDSERLGGVLSSGYLRSDIDQATTGNIRIQSNAKSISIGDVGHISLSTDPFTSIGVLNNSVNSGWAIRGRVNDLPVDLISINAITGAVNIPGAFSAPNSIATRAAVLSTPRAVTLTGSFVTGTGTTLFDGSAPLVINTSTTYTPLNVAGGTMTGLLTLPANGLTLGVSQLTAFNNVVGVGTSTPITTLDINGSFRVQIPTVTAGAEAIINCLTTGAVEIMLTSASTTVTLTNMTHQGQSIRLILRPAAGAMPSLVTIIGGPNIVWPNNVPPDLFVGINRVAIVTLLLVGSSKYATFVTY